MFFYQQSWPPFLYTSRSSSFPVVQVNVEIKFRGKKDSLSPDGHVIYRWNERGAWNAKFHLSYIISPPLPDGLTPDSLPLPQDLYGQRPVVHWRDNQIFSDG